ncbi:hypothetical protein [Treponema berlinense]|uniref:hypothetical protein n=1 Tax=Treponema berlinense TaxID=225004 RepID=UPI003F1093E2
MANAATALRAQYGFGDEKQLAQLEEILKGRTELKRGNGDGKAQTVTENGKRTVYLNSYKENMTREEQFALGITLGHEAYRDGITGGAQNQFNETAESVLGHTALAKRMQGDSMYNNMMTGLINTDINLKNDMTAFDNALTTGDWGAFGNYVGNNYDYSADYWRMTWSGQLLSDGDGWLKDMNGNYILNENGDRIGAEKQESGLLNIMNGTGGQSYASFTDEQKSKAQEIMRAAGLEMHSNGQWNNKLGKKLDMAKVMELSGDTIADKIFSAYYNNKVDSDLANIWQLDLKFSDSTLSKNVPDVANGRYSELVTRHLDDTATPAALMDKYTWSIYDKNGIATQLYKIDENNSFLDDLVKQTDSGLNSIINAYGCNFMSTIAFPQLLTGNILSASEIQDIWDYASRQQAFSWGDYKEMPWIIEQSEVKQPDLIANKVSAELGYDKLRFIFGGEHKYNQIGRRVKVPYRPDHFVTGSIYSSVIYNPANTIGKHRDEVPVYVYKK